MNGNIFIVLIVFSGTSYGKVLDVLHTHDGKAVQGEVLSVTDSSVRVRLIIRGTRGSGSSVRKIPMTRIRAIDFAPVADEEAFIKNPGALSKERLRALWNTLRNHLHRANSNAGRVGLTYAAKLLDERGRSGYDRAFDIYRTVEQRDWDTSRRVEARAGRLRALMAAGRAGEAVEEAGEIAEKTEDPGLLIEARYILAGADLAAMKELERENPKWQEDEEVHPRRELLFERALGHSLYPFLFHGSRTEEAARGLWFAREIYLFTGLRECADGCSKDITRLYPETSFAEKLKRSRNDKN